MSGVAGVSGRAAGERGEFEARIFELFPELAAMAEILMKSGMCDDVRDLNQAMAKILLGRELGIGPITSLLEVHFIRTKQSSNIEVGAKLCAALFRRSPTWDYHVSELTNEAVTIEVFRDGAQIGVSRFTREDAELAGLTQPRGQGESNHVKYPRNMFFARAMTNAVNWFASDLTCGFRVYCRDDGAIPERDASDEAAYASPASRMTLPDEADRLTPVAAGGGFDINSLPEATDMAAARDSVIMPPASTLMRATTAWGSLGLEPPLEIHAGDQVRVTLDENGRPVEITRDSARPAADVNPDDAPRVPAPLPDYRVPEATPATTPVVARTPASLDALADDATVERKLGDRTDLVALVVTAGLDDTIDSVALPGALHGLASGRWNDGGRVMRLWSDLDVEVAAGARITARQARAFIYAMPEPEPPPAAPTGQF